MNTINQCRVRQIGADRWIRVEWLPTKHAKVGRTVAIDGVRVVDGCVFKDVAEYEVFTVYQPALPEDIFSHE